ncbi:MAG: hypothetical protein ACK501_24510 [Planctomycetota bacterium]|jgi:hypothetical protein
MSRPTLRIVAIATALAAAATAAAQGPGPRVQTMQPAGGTPGSEVTVTLRGERLAKPLGALLDAPGIEVLDATGTDNGSCQLRLRLAADCAPGPHALRVRTAAGLSNLLPFHVGPLPAIAERRDGDQPMHVPLGTTVDGELRFGEVDRYTLDVPAGASVHVGVEAMRLGQTALDTRLVVRSADGRELAHADDTALGLRDPWLAFANPTATTITIELRSALPTDGRGGVYRLHLGAFDVPFGALPCGGAPGEPLDVELLGGAAGQRARVQLPDDGSERFAWHPPLAGGGHSPVPIWLRVGGPRNDGTTIDRDERTWFEVPGSVHGVVDTPGAPCVFHFRGQKGKEIELRVHARTLRSALDATLVVRGPDGKALGSNDDQNGVDSTLRITPPADGSYVVEVRDLLGTASPQHFFRLEAGPRERPRAVAMQVGRNGDPIVTLPRGGRAAMVLQRTGLDDKESLAVGELPAGVTCEAGPVLPGSGQQAFVFTAADEAALAASPLQIGLPSGERLDARVFRHMLPLLTGRNDFPLLATTTRNVPLVVTDPAPFTAAVEAPVVPLIRGASLALPLALTRRDGFDGRVRLRAAWTPPGLTVGQANLERGANNATLAVEANANAPLGEFPCLLVASTRSGNVATEQALPFVRVRVEEPWLTVAPANARAALGEAVTLRLPVTDVQPRRGPVTATMLGLPRGVTAAPTTLAVDQKELVFELTIAADAATGRHRELRVELQVPDANGASVLHRAAAGELRVLAKKPKPPAATAATTAALGEAR